MKIQDVAFICIYLGLCWRRDYRQVVWVGLVCLLVAIPLFKFWIFFTAERLTWYAAAFFLLAIMQQIYANRN